MTSDSDFPPPATSHEDRVASKGRRLDAMAVGRSILGPASTEPVPVVPGYEVIRLAGRGGLGLVWQARRLGDGQEVALKQPQSSDPEMNERLTIEAETLRTLHHPHIVQLLDFTSSTEGHPVLVMEWMDGANLATQLPDGGFDFEHALQIFLPVLDAVSHAHEHGIIHRDLKPSNILLTSDNVPKVSDFGLARSLNHRLVAFSMTRSGAVAGTVEYLAPECYRPDYESSTAADVYALGILLYELLTGTPPRGAWQRLSLRKPLDVRLDELISQMISPEPVRRPLSAQLIKQRLLEIRDTRPRLAGTPLVTPAVRAMDFAWTVLGLYLCGAAYGATLSQTRTPVPALFDLTFGTEGLLLRGFLAVWALSLGIGLLSIWQMIRLWRFRQVPMRESLPQPFGARLGHTRLAAGLVTVSQFLIFVLPPIFTLTVLFHSFHWRTPETALWEKTLVVTPWTTDEAVSPWRWDPVAFFHSGAYWLKEAQGGYSPGKLRVLDKTSFFVWMQPALMVLAAALTGTAMLSTFLMVIRQWWPRRRPGISGLLLSGGLGLAAFVPGWHADATNPQRERADLDFVRFQTAERVAHLAEAFTSTLMRQLILNEEPVPPLDVLRQSFSPKVPWSDGGHRDVGEIRAWAEAEYVADSKEPRVVEAHTAWSRHDTYGVDWSRGFAVRHSFIESRHSKSGRIVATQRQLDWYGNFASPSLMRVTDMIGQAIPLFTAEGRTLSAAEARDWMGRFLSTLAALGCEGLDDCFNPTFIALPGPEIDVRESRTAAFRRERELWQTVTFALVEQFPPPTPAAGGRWRLRPVIRQSGLRHGSIEPAAAVQFSMEFDLAFVGDGWRVVGF